MPKPAIFWGFSPISRVHFALLILIIRSMAAEGKANFKSLHEIFLFFILFFIYWRNFQNTHHATLRRSVEFEFVVFRHWNHLAILAWLAWRPHYWNLKTQQTWLFIIPWSLVNNKNNKLCRNIWSRSEDWKCSQLEFELAILIFYKYLP